MKQERIELSLIPSPGVDLELLELHPRSPFRPVDWRWRLARLLARPGVHSRRAWIDRHVRDAARYLRRATRLGRADHPRLIRRDLALAAAIALHADPVCRLAVEARVLADLPVEEVASRCGLAVDVVAIYELILFDVRPYLEQVDRTMISAVDPTGAFWTGSPSDEAVVRMLAFRGGEHAAEAALDVLSGGGANDVAEIPQGPARRLRMVTDLLRLPITPQAAPFLLRTYRLRVEIERRRAARRVVAVTGPVFRSDLGAQDDANRSILGALVRAAGAPEGPSERATRPVETPSPSVVASDSPSASHESARRTA